MHKHSDIQTKNSHTKFETLQDSDSDKALGQSRSRRFLGRWYATVSLSIVIELPVSSFFSDLKDPKLSASFSQIFSYKSLIFCLDISLGWNGIWKYMLFSNDESLLEHFLVVSTVGLFLSSNCCTAFRKKSRRSSTLWSLFKSLLKCYCTIN